MDEEEKVPDVEGGNFLAKQITAYALVFLGIALVGGVALNVGVEGHGLHQIQFPQIIPLGFFFCVAGLYTMLPDGIQRWFGAQAKKVFRHIIDSYKTKKITGGE